jgi:hypothetical protein
MRSNSFDKTLILIGGQYTVACAIQFFYFDAAKTSFLFNLCLYLIIFIIPIFIYVCHVFHLVPFNYLALDKIYFLQ